jgi:hypothetical protein
MEASGVAPDFLVLSAASRGLLKPLLPPGRDLEGIREILFFVEDLAGMVTRQGPLQLRIRFQVHPFFGMNPGTPVCTT